MGSMSFGMLLLLSVMLLALPGFALVASRRGPVVDRASEIRGPLRLLYWAFRVYCSAWHQLRSEGYAPLPESGPAILISNHTCGIDHMLLQSSCRRLLGFMIAREYFESRWLKGICTYIGCIPVNRDGRDVAAIRAALRALGQGRVLPIFPEGRIVPASGRRLGEMRPGVAYIAIRAGVPVVPAYIVGTPETDEILHSLVMPSRARVVYGEPIDLSDLTPHQAGDKTVQAEVGARFEQALLKLQTRALALANGDDHVEG
ncbi:MAG: lysophospholipid acyltransferase family protein [Isosphaeraceae bacterium]